MIRQPIVSVLGHVDCGKTTFLDGIRGSLIAEKEPGRITQSIGATEVPIEVIKNVCGPLIEKLGLKITIPGLLFIDTPGHAAFISLRKRGSVLSDIAVLILSFKEGIEEQTKEVLKILKHYKIPFVIALNKIDLINGWQSKEHCFLDNYKLQNQNAKKDLDNRIYELMGAFSKYNIAVDRFDNIKDFTKTVAIVPISAKTKEGIPELLMVLTGLSQQYLRDKLEVKKTFGRATVLEINEMKGFGTTADVILYDGVIKKEDRIVFRGKEGHIITEIKAILKPRPLKDMKTQKKFKNVDKVYPACGVRLVIKNTKGLLAGSPIFSVENPKEIKEALEKLEETKSEIKLSDKGVIIKSDSLGGLEALAAIFNEWGIPVKKAEVGRINKSDIVEAESEKRDFRLVFGFNTSLTDSAQLLKKEKNVQVFTSDIIYKLVDEYFEWKEKVEREKIEWILGTISRPSKIVLLPEYVFRKSNPAVVGVEVLEGVLVPNAELMNSEGQKIGKVLSIQKESESIKSSKKGEQVAISIQGAVIGRNIKENEILYTNIKGKDYKILKEYENYISDSENFILKEIIEIKNKSDSRWKFK